MDVKTALEKCKQLCSTREYCAYDIINKLNQWEITGVYFEQIIKQLTDEKFIDPERYISAFINDKLNFNHWGKIKIRHYLKQKQLPGHLINEHLEQINESEYFKIAKFEADKKKKLTRGKNDFEINQKVARYIVSKGFEAELVFKILKMD